jgi:hypothetical protein
VGTMSVASVIACSTSDSSTGIAADGCERLTVEGGEALRCHTGKYLGGRN